jgi:hypothetical protein
LQATVSTDGGMSGFWRLSSLVPWLISLLAGPFLNKPIREKKDFCYGCVCLLTWECSDFLNITIFLSILFQA